MTKQKTADISVATLAAHQDCAIVNAIVTAMGRENEGEYAWPINLIEPLLRDFLESEGDNFQAPMAIALLDTLARVATELSKSVEQEIETSSDNLNAYATRLSAMNADELEAERVRINTESARHGELAKSEAGEEHAAAVAGFVAIEKQREMLDREVKARFPSL